MEGANKDKTCDIADWISFFAWDFLGDMTWSKRMGFMENGADIGDMLGTAERVMRYFSVVSLFGQSSREIARTIYIFSTGDNTHLVYRARCSLSVAHSIPLYILSL